MGRAAAGLAVLGLVAAACDGAPRVPREDEIPIEFPLEWRMPAPGGAEEAPAGGGEEAGEQVVECGDVVLETLPIDIGNPGPALLSPRPVAPGAAGDAVEEAPDWLSRHQSPDGSWSAEGFDRCTGVRCTGPGDPARDAGRTALALLAFFAEGETHRTPRHGAVVRAGLKRLKWIQDEEGCFGPREDPSFPEDHALATLAMVEAYGMTSSPLFKASAENGVAFLLSCRTPCGGWRPWSRYGEDDPILTAWAAMALASARCSGLGPEPEVFEGALAAMERVPIPGAEGEDPAEAAAAALLVRSLCGQPRDHPDLVAAADAFLERHPREGGEGPGPRLLEWYFGTLFMYRMGSVGFHRWEGEWWSTWSSDLDAALEPVRHGEAAGCADGSADPSPGEFGRAFGRAGTTAVVHLVEAVFYR